MHKQPVNGSVPIPHSVLQVVHVPEACINAGEVDVPLQETLDCSHLLSLPSISCTATLLQMCQKPETPAHCSSKHDCKEHIPELQLSVNLDMVAESVRFSCCFHCELGPHSLQLASFARCFKLCQRRSGLRVLGPVCQSCCPAWRPAVPVTYCLVKYTA